MLDQLVKLVEQHYGTGAYLTLHNGSWSIRSLQGDILNYDTDFDKLNEQLTKAANSEDNLRPRRQVSASEFFNPEEFYSFDWSEP